MGPPKGEPGGRHQPGPVGVEERPVAHPVLARPGESRCEPREAVEGAAVVAVIIILTP